ncbi:GAF domain-containing protein [Luteimonas sp. BDR2-5]|uniref:GAF domain-containing protein n=1 Tax=Proluteimonas luteida TaxID=2878685 RepID=UPI001E542462|nr:GAF domain-containing protein [Luteimonas sp. BDR2-5]MCD9027793.1 GAF domain-containing protein [Luteimonas sp. BDR2-5]
MSAPGIGADFERALQTCADEPIHLSGAIQPHGYLISCRLPDWTIHHVSANIEALTGTPAVRMLRQSLRGFLTDDLIEALAETIGFGEPGAPSQRAAVGNIGPMAQLCDVSVHVVDGLVHIEIEPQPRGTGERSPTVVAQAMIARVAASEDLEDFHQRVAEQVRALTGYDRVMVYRFRHDGAGEVIAESRDSALPAYLGLRYPASDIPVQARALYLRNRIRVIPDAGYAPVPVVPDRDEAGAPLDLGQLALRSVSPVHLEYLANMGVAASMSLSIISGGRLWGLIACHHRAPRAVPPGVRAAADLFGLFVSMRVAAREQKAAFLLEENAREIRDVLAQRLDGASEPRLALAGELDLVGRTVDSDGVGLVQSGRWHTAGRTPDVAHLPGLMDWVARCDAGGNGIAATARAQDWCAGGADADGLAGVLAVPLDPFGGEWLFFFRCEQIEDVRWAGSPDAPLQIDESGDRIGPRTSFSAWHQTVRGCAEPWRDADCRVAARLHLMLRERYRRSASLQAAAGDLQARRTRLDVREQRVRLLQLSELLEGLVHVGPQEAAQLSARINLLESELQALIGTGGAAED